MDIFKKRGLKIWGIIFCLVICYVMLYRVFNEVDFQRYPNIFVAFIEAYLNGHFTLHYFKIFSLLDSNVFVNPSLPNMVQEIMKTESYFVLTTYLFIILHFITGLSPQLLIVLPLGVIFLPIMWLAVIKAYIPLNNKSNVVFSVLFAIYSLLFTVTTKQYGSFYVTPASFLLLLLTILCIQKIYYSQNKKVIYVAIVYISYFSLALYWHTMLMASLLFIISIYIISGSLYSYSSLIDKTNNQYKQFFNTSKLLAITPIIISLTFIHLWQSGYLNEFMAEASIWEFISKAILKFQGKVAFEIPYSYNYKDFFFGDLYFKSLLLIYLFAILILAIPIFLNIYYHKTQSRNIEMPFILTISIFVSQVAHVFLYYKTDSLSFFYTPLFFTFFGIQLFANTIKKEDSFYRITKYFIIFSLIILTVLSLISIFSLRVTNEAGETSTTTYINTESSFNWAYTHLDHTSKLIVDFNILGKYLQREAYMPKLKLDYADLNPQSYSYYVGDNNNTSSNNISFIYANSNLVIDHATMEDGKPINLHENRATLSPRINEINNCTHQHKIYDDNYISIFQIWTLQKS